MESTLENEKIFHAYWSADLIIWKWPFYQKPFADPMQIQWKSQAHYLQAYLKKKYKVGRTNILDFETL